MQVDVLDSDTGERLFGCDGPDAYGGCRRAPREQVLPCEGHSVQTRSGPGRLDSFRFAVSGSGTACPLRALVLGLGGG